MAYDRVIRFVISEGEALAQSVLSEIPRRRTLNYPAVGPGPIEFLGFLEEFVKYTHGEMVLLREQLPSTPADIVPILLSQAKRANFVLKYAIQLLDWVSGAALESLPFSLVPACERVLRRFHPDACIIFRSTLDYNYELQTLPRESLRAVVPWSLLEKYSWPVIVVRIPAAPIADTLTHSLISHELGHAVYNALRPHIDREQPSGEEVIRIARPYLASLGIPSLGMSVPEPSFEDLLVNQFGRNVVARIGKLVSVVVENWIQEFFADSIGCLLVGPAFFCAYTSFLVAVLPLDRASRDHPPDRMRLDSIFLVLEEQDNAGYSRDMLTTQVQSLLVGWIGALQEIPREGYAVDPVESATFEVAERIVKGCLPDVRRAARRAVEDIRYKASDYQRDVEPFVRLLEEERMPPIERISEEGRAVPLRLASVLNVGWEVLLRQEVRCAGAKIGDDALGGGAQSLNEDLYRQRVSLNEKIFRAIDLGEIRRQWEAVDGNSGIQRTS